MTQGKKQGPFDERAALDDLERFRADIERYRKQRETVSEDFDEFVRSFPSPVEVFPSENSGVQANAVEKRTAQAAPPPPAPPVVAAPAETAPGAGAPSLFADEVDRTKRSKTPFVVAVLVLLIAGAVGAWFYSTQVQPETSTPAVAVNEQSQPAAPVAPPPAPAPVAPPVESEITTVRTAWVRVIADGERVLERELPANARVPFKAEKTIVIRTGDAGAVRLSIRGTDQGVLGRDGDVITRSFAVPANPSSQ